MAARACGRHGKQCASWREMTRRAVLRSANVASSVWPAASRRTAAAPSSKCSWSSAQQFREQCESLVARQVTLVPVAVRLPVLQQPADELAEHGRAKVGLRFLALVTQRLALLSVAMAISLCLRELVA